MATHLKWLPWTSSFLANLAMVSLAQSGTGSEAFLGVASVPLPSSLRESMVLDAEVGLLVGHIHPQSCAQGKLRVNDVLLQFNDQWLFQHEQLAALVRKAGIGVSVQFTIVRDGAPQQVMVELGQRQTLSVRSLSLPFTPVASKPGDFFAIWSEEGKTFYVSQVGGVLFVDEITLGKNHRKAQGVSVDWLQKKEALQHYVSRLVDQKPATQQVSKVERKD